ncbi:MAG: LysR family transcriptional regulator [Burkholderiaceae bacterium]|nr:LysR family transcriptional regulator [Burkholderiaceae bacterium]
METMRTLEAFLRTAEGGSFSEAARRLGLTPAAVSKSVAMLESRLGVRLFQRSTRRLALTEDGARLLHGIGSGLDSIQAAIDETARRKGRPAGVLKVSMGPAFGREFILPLLPEFLARYPDIVPDLRFEQRSVDLVGEGYDAAIGGGFELPLGVVARELGPAHAVVVAAPSYLASRGLRNPPAHPSALADHDALLRRSEPTGRVRPWLLRRARDGAEAAVEPRRVRAILDDPQAVAEAAGAGLGVAVLPLFFVSTALSDGRLVRLLPGWYQDGGGTWIYFPRRDLLPAKTRVFVDFIVERFEAQRFATRMRAVPGRLRERDG